MKFEHGIALPDADKRFAAMIAANPLYLEKGTYQFKTLENAVSLCRDYRCAVDVGAHVGLWTRPLAHMFDEVIAFEPIRENIKCLKVNIADRSNVTFYPWVVGKEDNGIYVTPVHDNSGNAYINERGQRLPGSYYSHCTTIDDMDLTTVDFLKIDVEGYELFVIQGAEQTIKRDHPVIVCEQKPANSARYGLGETDAIDLLQSWGYRVAFKDGEDYACCPL